MPRAVCSQLAHARPHVGAGLGQIADRSRDLVDRTFADRRDRRVELRRAATPIGDEYLLCEISAGDLFLLRETYALDEAWRVAEETERCGRKLGQLHIETSALIAMGSMARLVARSP